MKVTVKPCARDHNENFETSKFSRPQKISPKVRAEIC